MDVIVHPRIKSQGGRENGLSITYRLHGNCGLVVSEDQRTRVLVSNERRMIMPLRGLFHASILETKADKFMDFLDRWSSYLAIVGIIGAILFIILPAVTR